MDNAISFISSDQARKNHLQLVSKGLSWDDQQAHTEKMWSERLSVVQIEQIEDSDDAANETSVLLKKMYTGLYHANLAPSIFDEDGIYLSFNTGDMLMKVSGADHAYTDMSIWDIHRTQLPWLSLTAPDVLRDVLHSLQRMMEQGGGDIPRWPIANIYAECMIGSHAFVSIADSVKKGQASTLNLTSLYTSMKRTATVPRERAGRACVLNYTRLGYVPDECSAQSASLTLAYAFDDAAVATVATAVGAMEDAAMFRNRSRAAYKHLWDKKRMLLCPRKGVGANPELVCPLDPALPYPIEKKYTEGDALQWLWFVPHDIEGLVDLFPTPAAFVSKLHQFFLDARTIKQGGKWAGGTWLANAWYWAGNEPDILAPFLFPLAGRAYHNYTSFWSRWLVDNDYGVKADGLPGNDDYGTLSSWLLWSVAGLYPLSGSEDFVLGAPRFEKMWIRRRHLDPAVADLCIVGHNVSLPGHTAVRKIVLNGVEVTGSVIKYADFSHGPSDAILEFFMVKG
jgi:predicted alpha-1,2-mannosidase